MNATDPTAAGSGPSLSDDLVPKLLGTTSGLVSLVGLLVTVAGMIVVARAGARKDLNLTAEQKVTAGAEFDFRRGIWVAIFSGIMSGCYAYGLAAGEPIRQLGAAAGTGTLWVGLPVICLVTFGGLITNGVWCSFLIVRNGSFGQWLGRTPAEAPAGEERVPLLRDYLLAALGGVLWHFQLFFSTMDESQMGRLGFSSWTIHKASIIIFGTVWGFALREWRDAAPATRRMVWSGVALNLSKEARLGELMKCGSIRSADSERSKQ